MRKLWRWTVVGFVAVVGVAVGQSPVSVCVRFRGRGGGVLGTLSRGPVYRTSSPGRVRPPFARWRLNVMRGGH